MSSLHSYMFKVVTTLLRLQVQLEATLHTLHTFCLFLSEVLKLVIMIAIMLLLIAIMILMMMLMIAKVFIMYFFPAMKCDDN